MTFGYGVSDLGSGYRFYEPFSYDICVGELTGLIQAMFDQCVPQGGIDLHFVPLDWAQVDLNALAPSLKFYSFHT